MTTMLRALVLVAFLGPAVADAQKTNLRDAPPIRTPLEWRNDRHQLTPLFGFSLNDVYTRSLSLGLTYRYYPANWVGIGVDVFGTYVVLDSALTESIKAELDATDRGVPSTAAPGIIADVAATFIPLYGKMMWFGTLPVAYDFQIDVGLGMIRTRTTGELDPQTVFAPMWGIGARLFFNDFIAVELGMKDYIAEFAQIAAPGDTSGEVAWRQNFMFTFGVSFFLPPTLVRGE
jgi:outer membrane beta-barrel protein